MSYTLADIYFWCYNNTIMTSVLSGERITGINWSIERGLVSPDIAANAALEIVDSISNANPMISFDHSQPKVGYSGYLIAGLEGITEEDMVAADFPYANLMVVRKSLEIFKDPSLLAEPDAGHYDEAFVNITEPFGKIPLHIDREPWSLVFVSLAGRVRGRIKHIDEPTYAEEILTPGDAVRIINPMSKRQRPKHEFVNLSDFRRISYGEYTNQLDSRGSL